MYMNVHVTEENFQIYYSSQHLSPAGDVEILMQICLKMLSMETTYIYYVATLAAYSNWITMSSTTPDHKNMFIVIFPYLTILKLIHFTFFFMQSRSYFAVLGHNKYECEKAEDIQISRCKP